MPAAVDTRQKLMDAARDLIYARSYCDVGVQEICQQAGVRKGSFYHFFPSKKDLTLAVLDNSWAYLRDTLIRSSFAPERTPLERLEHFMENLSAFHQQVKNSSGCMHGCQFGNLASEMSTRDEAIRRSVERIFAEIEAPIAEALSAAVEAGDLPPIDVQASAEAMFAYVEGLVLLAKTRNDPGVIRRLGRNWLQLVVPVVGH